MKKLLLASLCALSLFALAPSSHAGHVGVSIGIGIPIHSSPCYRPSYYPGYCSRPYYRPAYYPYYYSAPIVYSEPVVERVYVQSPAAAVTEESIAYGTVASQGVVKSPWSDFTMSTGGKTPGQIVYDSNNGKAFRVP
jgi:hypothetical protein